MKFTAYANIIISLAAFFHSLTTFILFDQELDLIVLTFIFSSTLFLYNFLRIMKIKTIPAENHSEQLHWASRHLKLITIISGASFLSSVVLFFFLSSWQQLIVLATGIIAFGYNIQFGKKPNSLRNIPFMKGIWISFVWTCITLLLPLSNHEFIWNTELFLMRFLFVFALVIPFDIRDLKYDDPSLKTIPQLLGIKGAILFGWILMITCFCVANDLFDGNKAMMLSISYGLTGIVLLFSSKNRKEIFYPFAIDGMMILQGCMMLIVM